MKIIEICMTILWGKINRGGIAGRADGHVVISGHGLRAQHARCYFMCILYAIGY